MVNNKNHYKINVNTNKFKKNTVLKYINCSYSGKCYLMADLKDDLNREWIMYYELEKK